MPDDQDLPDLDYDREKVDETVLTLLWLALHDYNRAWKGHDWDVLDRLYKRGYIDDPKNKANSVLLTEEGKQRSKELFARYFSAGESRGTIPKITAGAVSYCSRVNFNETEPLPIPIPCSIAWRPARLNSAPPFWADPESPTHSENLKQE